MGSPRAVGAGGAASDSWEGGAEGAGGALGDGVQDRGSRSAGSAVDRAVSARRRRDLRGRVWILGARVLGVESKAEGLKFGT